ncbi:trans-resveratrol di-O-methyltransferase-like [Carica papaya]|uniref:trans-resveratrol di-O-methyltransferase-like n=1 Tax=Carica papaya TaxID=3649 RepID=UPI000B8CA0A8|nr:trans-resveratrol di-O-methyltransferase-like [Carica papaya]
MQNMSSIDGKNIDRNELLKAQANVWNHIFSFIHSACLKCAVELGILDIIHNYAKPITDQQIISALPINPSKADGVHRLMRILVNSGFFKKEKINPNELEEGYVLTTSSQLLLKNNPFSNIPFLFAMVDPILMNPWPHLSTWFQNDDPTPFYTAHGITLWNYTAREPRFNNLFNEAMTCDSHLVTTIIINNCKDVFTGLKKVVDVGGGTGKFTRGLAQQFPNLEFTVFDLPQVVDGLQSTNNLTYLGGDMFEAIPPADGIMFKWVLHNWNDKDCEKILERCKESIMKSDKRSGKVIIIDIVMEKEKEDIELIETQLLFDMVIMANLPGKQRTEEEWATLFFHAGFHHYKIIPALGTRSIIELYL